MKKVILTLALVAMLAVMTVMPVAAGPGNTGNGNGQGNGACWGQATAVFAQMGMMGEHSSSFETPRSGLRNLARILADAGIIPDDSMHSLGVFVASDLGLEIDACMD